jgi:hypothetical protein
MNDFDQSKSDDPWDFIGNASGEGELDVRAIHDFVIHLQEEKIHPILIFGATFSGKTMMILSLLHYATRNSRADMRIWLGDPVFPPNFPFADERYRDAEQVYNLLTIEYARGERPPATQKIAPFFIPINIEVRGETHKLAFLEGNGEWYERDDYSFRPFKQEIAGVLSGLAAPVSVIFVAPAWDERGRGKLNFSHECLAHCVEQYERTRLARDRDNLLLLLSKWDGSHSPGRADGHFSDASVADVLAEIEPWRFIWQQFGNLNGPARALTPFSAGAINESGVFFRERKYQGVFDKFNLTVWNWIYGNVTMANNKETPLVRKNLYEDGTIRRTKAPTLYQNLVKKSLWI